MKVAILGMGRMGSWLALELSREHRVAVFDADPQRQAPPGKEVVRLGTIRDLRSYGPELFINAVFLSTTVAAFEEAAPYLDRECLICDVASIKGKIADYYRSGHARFVSIHPMFGPTFADMEKGHGENAVIITESCAEGRDFWRAFFVERGVRIFEYSFEEHDRMMAYSLTIPFVSSMVFAACVDAKTVPGTTFTRHMAMARKLLSEDDHLLAEILFNPHSLTELSRITSRLEFLKHIIAARDEDEARELFRGLRENIGGPEAPDPQG